MADGFFAGAEAAKTFEYWDAAGLLIIHAAIAYTDAIRIKVGGVTRAPLLSGSTSIGLLRLFAVPAIPVSTEGECAALVGSAVNLMFGRGRRGHCPAMIRRTSFSRTNKCIGSVGEGMKSNF